MGGQGSGGHNRKTAEEHKLAGTYRASRHGLRAVNAQALPEPAGESPAPPAGLSPHAVAEWERFTAAYPRRFATDLQALVTLETLVRAADRHREAREIIDLDGVLLEGARGGRQAHPLLRAERAAAADMLRALHSLKLEPAPAAEGDPFAPLNELERIQRQAARRG